MSIVNYKKAIECIENNRKEMFFGKGASKELVNKAEKALEIKLPFQYRDFVERYGALSFDGTEIYGVTSDNFQNGKIPNGIWYTLDERKKYNLPKQLLIIYHTGAEEYFCLDFSKLNEEGEPAVVAYAFCVDVEYQTYEKIADDFGDFLLDMLKFSEIYKK